MAKRGAAALGDTDGIAHCVDERELLFNLGEYAALFVKGRSRNLQASTGGEAEVELTGRGFRSGE